MASILKVDTIQDQAGNNIINENANVITIGASGDTIAIPSGASMSGFTSTGIDDNATSTAITIDSSEQVGINTTSPQAPLHIIDGSGSVSGASYRTTTPLVLENNGNTELQFFSNSSSNAQIRFGDSDSNFAGALTYNHSTDIMAFYTNTLERIRIDSSGQVGIGTTSPQGTLSVEGEGRIVTIGDSGTTNVPEIKARNNTDTGNAFLRISSYTTEFYTEGTEAMRINTSGNVGIGTSSPSPSYGTDRVLEVSGASAPGIVINDTGQASKYGIHADSNDLKITYGSTPLVTFQNDGNVGIGTTTPTEKLHVNGNILITNNNALKINDTSGAKEILKVDNFNQTILKNANDSRDIIIRNAADTNLVTIDPTGDVSITGALSKGSGSFKIDHPLSSKTNTHHLVHSFIESPQADLIYRGKVDLVNGTATVNIDTVAGMSEGTFVLLNRDIQCFTSNETGWTAVKGSVSGNTLTITAQDNTCDDTISWLVVGERQDQHIYDTSWTDDNGKVIVEPLKETEQQQP